MLIHVNSCAYNYANTSKYFEVKQILDVYGKAERRLFLVDWENHPGKESWLTEHSLLSDGCKDSIDDFWLRTGKNPALDFYPDPENRPRCWMCG